MVVRRSLFGGNLFGRVFLKTVLGVCVGSVCFALYAYIYNLLHSAMGYLTLFLMVVWGWLFAILPAVVGVLLVWFGGGFRLEQASARRSWCLGFVKMFYGVNGMFASPALVGGWMNVQVFSEIQAEERGV
ncbi:MAG: hypothetical protein DDG60_06670 [Anaerolineae bacterium]|nr:MAG: hypothetical protein DDG60_06670 [Anaerolineae bacterium]